MARRRSRAIDTRSPVNWSHPLNRSRRCWWMVLPSQTGGYVLRDITRSGFDGTLTNFATLATGVSGWRPASRPGGYGSILFDGIDDTVTVNGPALTRFTIAAWTYNNGANASPVILKVGGGFWQITSTGKMRFSPNGGSNFDGTATVTANAWHRLVTTWDGTSTRHYLDGVLTDTVAGGNNLNAANLIGGYNGVAANQWAGSLDDVTIAGRVWTTPEVALDYDLSRRGYPHAIRRLRRTTFANAGFASLSSSDAASISAAASLVASFTGTDAAALADAATLAASYIASDAGSMSSSSSLAASVTGVDAATIADVLALAASLASSDAASFGESWSLTQNNVDSRTFPGSIYSTIRRASNRPDPSLSIVRPRA